MTKGIDEQIKRLEQYLEDTKPHPGTIPQANNIAIEQALALAYIARELATPPSLKP